MKIGILDSHNQNYDYLGRYSIPNRIKYCEKHGYDFVRFRFDKLDRTPHWGRMLGLQKHLPDYDWMFYLDTDALIMNDTIKLESYIDDNYNLIVGPQPHEGHMSTSGMLIKNCPWSFELLEAIWAQTQFINNPYNPDPAKGDHNATAGDGGGLYFEQSSLQCLYDQQEKFRNKIKVVPRKWFNSLVHTYEDGHFLIHFPGESWLKKERMHKYNILLQNKNKKKVF